MYDRKRSTIGPGEDSGKPVTASAHLFSFCIFCDFLRDFHMLTILGGDILFVTGNVIFSRNQAEKSLERGVVPFERFQ